MKTLPLIIGLVAAGAIGALAAIVMQPSDNGDGLRTGAVSDPRVAELINSVDRLRQEVADLKATPPLVVDAPAMASAGGAKALDESGGTDAAATAPVEGEQFEKAVEKAVAKSREKQWEAVGKMWTDRAAQREKSMVTQFAKDQGLTDYQRDEMIKTLDKRREKLTPLFRAMFAPPADGETRDMAKIREDMEKVRDDTVTDLKGLISEDQVEAFQKEESSRRGGFGMGGGGGGGRAPK